MVKKISYLGLALALSGWAVGTGCNKASNPVVPAHAAVLNLVIPPNVLNALKSQAVVALTTPTGGVPDPGVGALEFCLLMPGEAPVTGVVPFTSGSEVGNFFINLPKAGVWVVSAEWFSLGNLLTNPVGGAKKERAKLVVPGYSLVVPEFVGAGEVNVQGTTSFTLNMEDINYEEYACYNAYLTDSTDCDFGEGYDDLFTFNAGTATDSEVTIGSKLPSGDIWTQYDSAGVGGAVATNTTYFGRQIGSQTTYTYLGNGDLVNFPVVPSGASFYPNTLEAKAAVVGSAAATLAEDDIFVVSLPSQNAMVWLQVTSDVNECGEEEESNSSLVSFWFVYNNEGLDYMKFDQTVEGAVDCNLNVPTPTPIIGT